MSQGHLQVLHIITRLDPGGSAENTVLSVERVDPARYASTLWTGPGLAGGGPPLAYADRLGDRLQVIHQLVRPIQPVHDIAALSELVRSLRHTQPDIIHLHSAKAGVLGRIAAKLARSRAKVIYTPHGHVFSGYGDEGANRLFTWIEKRLASWADAIVGLTADEIREFQSHGAGKPEQFCVIPSGVVLDDYLREDGVRERARQEFDIATDAKVVGFIGRFEPVKGPDLALEVMALVLGEQPDVRFLFVGDGAMKSELQKRATELGITDSIIWSGWRDDIPRLMKAMDVFLLTSRNEGQGRVLVEAMASSLPVVAMASGGVSEVVLDGHTGLLTEPCNSAQSANVLLALLSDETRARKLGLAGRERALNHFSADEMIRRLERLYSGMVEGQNAKSILPW